MTPKISGLIAFIRENADNDFVRLYPSDLEEIGVTALEADKILEKLNKVKAVFEKRVAFASNKIQSTYPLPATFSSVENSTYSIPVFLFRIDESRLQVFLNENLTSSFSDKEAAIKVGKKIIKLPPTKNEHSFCRVAFKYPVGTAVDWSEIYEEMTGNDFLIMEGNDLWRGTYDAMESVNTRVKKQTGKGLFKWSGKTVQRLY